MKIMITVPAGSLVLEHDDTEIFDMHDTFRRLEEELVKYMIKCHGNNKTAAASSLKLNRTTFIEKCRKFGIPLHPGRVFRRDKK